MKALRFIKISGAVLVLLIGGSAFARYLQPEPILRSPWSQVYYAYMGVSLPVYAYAGNNPLYWVDYNGLWIMPTPGDMNLRRGLDRMLQSPRARELYNYLHNQRPERIPLSSGVERWNEARQKFEYGRTNLKRRPYGRNAAACSAVTDPVNEGTFADPALNIAHELAHLEAFLKYPGLPDQLHDQYVDEIEMQVQQELTGLGIFR